MLQKLYDLSIKINKRDQVAYISVVGDLYYYQISNHKVKFVLSDRQ